MEERKDVLAVQTLRNSTMAATFLASTAIFLITGVLTLSTQGDRLAATWQILDAAGTATPDLFRLDRLPADVVVDDASGPKRLPAGTGSRCPS